MRLVVALLFVVLLHRLGDPVPLLPVPVPPLADPLEVVPDRNPPVYAVPVDDGCAPPSLCDVPHPEPYRGGDPEVTPVPTPTAADAGPYPAPPVYGVLRRVVERGPT